MNQTVTSAVTSVPTATSGPTATTTHGNTSGAGSGTILLPHPSPSLSAQAVGQLVRAVVVGPADDGKIIVDTRYGKFALPLTTAPAAGSVLQLQIAKASNPVELLLVGLEAKAPSIQTSAILNLPQPPPALLTLTKGEFFRGLVTNASANGNTIVSTRFGQLSLPLINPPANGSSLQLQIVKSGTPLELRLVAAEAPVAGQGSTAKGGPPTMLAVGETVLGRYTPTAGNSAAVPNGLAAGGFHARIVALHTTPPASATGGNDTVVSGRIVSSQAGGPTVIETAAGRIILPTAGGAVADRYVTLQIIAEPGTVLPTNPGAAHLRSLTSLSQNWTALAELIGVAKSADPQIAAQFTATAVPNTGATLTTGIVLFLSLLTRGQVPEWLGGDMVRLMQSNNRQALLSRLGDDFSQIVRLAGELANSDWRMAMLPLLHDGNLQQIRMYLRERHGGGKEGDESLDTRFVIEASLSHLGNIQLDGLVRPARFDMMVRTQKPLPQYLQSEISTLFTQANEEFAVQGRINFQVRSQFPVGPTGELSDPAVGVYA